jgi:3-oxoacyl-[acyl-carrier-protein] synthase-1
LDLAAGWADFAGAVTARRRVALDQRADLAAVVPAGVEAVVGDVTEVEAIRRVFGQGTTPPIASTKSLTGHCLGGAGVWEAIYSLIMMNKGFIAASANVTTLDPALDPSEIVTTLREGVAIDSVLSNSFGFGGTNASLVLGRVS